jgi:HTH-type transcriptional regulator/antitoxin HigA
MVDRIVAEVFPPGEFIREELEARAWTQADLADVLGRPPRLVSEIISGKRSITPETAKGLGEAFGTGAQFWMNLESVYQLSRVKSSDDTVARRARLYGKAPVKEMVRRNWIEESKNVDVLEQRVIQFFGIKSVDEQPAFLPHAHRKTAFREGEDPSQLAWLFRARNLAGTVQAGKFSDRSFNVALDRLHTLLQDPEDIRQVPRVLSEAGIRFLVIEPLAHTRIDGVCFWLRKESPVLALSLRFDRIDWFWFTLFHELKHVLSRDGLTRPPVLDTNLVGEGAQKSGEKPTAEREADRFAAERLVAKSEIEDFIARVRPLYSKQKIQGFAARVKVHPGIVVGQLQHRGEIGFAHNREMLTKVRHIITASTLTDGWGFMPRDDQTVPGPGFNRDAG